ncbi:MAG: response regulator [Desulfomonile tiedjei]|uniref:Response regulator n=1 Tax=Desulfomonile tiedjei TaxID=2358 RepID=A0A9D6Z4X6_9BACT|nr:response regulator [Desulfomonile tiedjei]
MSTILHVEDENAVRFLYKEVFEELGYNVIQASSAEEALKMLKGNRPDVIILDLKMPGMGGRAFLEKFHKMKLRIPVVISTAYPYLQGDPSALGADAYVVKSGDMTELVETVNGLVNESSLLRHGK